LFNPGIVADADYFMGYTVKIPFNNYFKFNSVANRERSEKSYVSYHVAVYSTMPYVQEYDLKRRCIV